MIGKIETAIGDRSRIECDLAGDGFMHAPLAASSFAYLPLPPGHEGIEYLEYPQLVVGMHSHEPIAIAGSPDLSTNENGLFEQATRSWTNGINLKNVINSRASSLLFSSKRHVNHCHFFCHPPDLPSSHPAKFSSFGGGGAVSDVAIARFWCFGGDMTETAVTDLVGMV